MRASKHTAAIIEDDLGQHVHHDAPFRDSENNGVIINF